MTQPIRVQPAMKIGITDYMDAGLDQSWRSHMDKVAGAILITKAPQLLGEVPANTVVHCTITGWGGTKMEPGIAGPEVTLPAYHRLVRTLGRERTVLRVDPIIPTGKGFEVAAPILKFAKVTGSRVRISFLDGYAHARRRIQAAYGADLPWQGLHAPLVQRQALLKRIRGEIGLDPEVCGEPGLICTGCISARDVAALGLACKLSGKCGQRKDCRCAAEKWEFPGPRKRCAGQCLYCFWRDAPHLR